MTKHIPTASASSSTPSLANVAALAGVSSATASRVLSGKRTKDDDIARNVRDAAIKLNYSVNHAASALRSDVTNTIGLIASNADDPFVAQLIGVLEPMISQRSQQLALGLGGTATLLKQRIAAMTARHVDGLIIATDPGVDLTDVLEHHARRIPIVQVGGTQRAFCTSMIGIDNAASMTETLRHLAKVGVRSAAFLHGPRPTVSAAGNGGAFDADALLSAFDSQTTQYGLFTRREWNDRTAVPAGTSTMAYGFDYATRLFANSGDGNSGDGDAGDIATETRNDTSAFQRRPEALICINDAIAMGALHALHALGLRVPQDVCIVSHGDTPLATLAMPQLTSLQPPTQQIAAEALRLIDADRDCPAHVFLLPHVIVRDSTQRSRS
ncbi:LacI family DNA-binding transcriptional regulator [Bifidobacterium callimiconis]|uniref:LacI family transcriptional regulator n=1 Tax=Bifidobacterium callimiconis TaxID=2306973 RepID=A0A430FBW9_9BIFI|nr:LacI family DNA-binding transcriptional regulator [Bifidobacterium callimiconis]RSX50282.1 LacI family transcriptional regulator [Bifidobacterium callimiconis]